MIRMISAERLREILRYDPETGLWYWLISPAIQIHIGAIAGCFNKVSGYQQIRFDRHGYRAHRLAFLYMLGAYPDEVDHINGNRADNRWSNLRAVTRLQNAKNRKIDRDNKLGIKGVRRSPSGKFEARIVADRVEHYLGKFETQEAAKIAYLNAAIQYHGPFLREGA